MNKGYGLPPLDRKSLLVQSPTSPFPSSMEVDGGLPQTKAFAFQNPAIVSKTHAIVLHFPVPRACAPDSIASSKCSSIGLESSSPSPPCQRRPQQCHARTQDHTPNTGFFLKGNQQEHHTCWGHLKNDTPRKWVSIEIWKLTRRLVDALVEVSGAVGRPDLGEGKKQHKMSSSNLAALRSAAKSD